MPPDTGTACCAIHFARPVIDGVAKPAIIRCCTGMSTNARCLLVTAALIATPAHARDSLGIFEGWGAFRDPASARSPLRCYAIAEPDNLPRGGSWRPFASFGYWPRANVRGQAHFRLSRTPVRNARVTLSIGAQRFALIANGADAWARDRAMDAAIVAALRNAPGMSIASTGPRGTFADIYPLRGAATAIDAAAVGCTAR